MPRIALYSHDTLGLGHLRRTLKLAQHLAGELEQAEGLILTGSPWHSCFPLPPAFRTQSLPAIVKTRQGRYQSRSADTDLESVLRARRARISDSLAGFRPDLFVVDNVPCGLEGEVVEALNDLKHRGARTVLALRDVLDEPSALRREWELSGATSVVVDLFDEIWVFGDAADTAALTRGGVLSHVAGKVRRCGRIGPRDVDPPAATTTPRHRSLQRVLVTGGGGRDAVDLVQTYLRALRLVRPSVSSLVVLGPDYPPARRERLETTDLAGLELTAFVPDLPAELIRSDVIVSMAGYNTVCEILASGRPTLLVPRVTPRREQLIRARKWERRGRAMVLDPRDLSPRRLWRAVEVLLESPSLPGLTHRGGQVAAGRAAALLSTTVGDRV